ncbi:MAG: thermonuclease family protein [Candidatus Omnitrophota bacterium]
MKSFIRRYLFIPILILIFLFCPAYAQDNKFFTSQVIRIVSGDTLELKYGEKVRLIGISCPEVSIEEGKQAVESLENIGIMYRTVLLKFDEQKYDKYGRLLAYVYFDLSQLNNDIYKEEIEKYFYYDENKYLFLNATLVNAGYAQPIIVQPNVKYTDLFKELHQEAVKNKWGMWKKLDEQEARELASKLAEREAKKEIFVDARGNEIDTEDIVFPPDYWDIIAQENNRWILGGHPPVGFQLDVSFDLDGSDPEVSIKFALE